MTARFEWGYAADVHDKWCARKAGVRARMLCSRRVGWMPPVPHPFAPPNVCPDCARLLQAGPPYGQTLDEQAEGTCPECVGQVPLDADGRVAAHGEWSWQNGRLEATKIPCAGEGEWPEGAE